MSDHNPLYILLKNAIRYHAAMSDALGDSGSRNKGAVARLQNEQDNLEVVFDGLLAFAEEFGHIMQRAILNGACRKNPEIMKADYTELMQAIHAVRKAAAADEKPEPAASAN